MEDIVGEVGVVVGVGAAHVVVLVAALLHELLEQMCIRDRDYVSEDYLVMSTYAMTFGGVDAEGCLLYTSVLDEYYRPNLPSVWASSPRLTVARHSE